MPADSAAVMHARLLWRCRRGTRELDLLLQRWLRQHYGSADLRQRSRFESLLELPDPELADYLLHGAAPEPADAALEALLAAIRDPGAATGTGAASPQDSDAGEVPAAVLCPTEVAGTSDAPLGQTPVCTAMVNGRGQSGDCISC
jgi:antitoxin CptB